MIVVFVDVVNICCRCERREKELFFIELYDFLSRKIHMELLQCFLYLEKHCSNFKKKIGKVLYLENLLECEQWGFLSKK